jgi:K+-transporting ATPase ATPase C chain
LQVARVASARHLDSVKAEQVKLLVQQYNEAPQWNIFGQVRVNVLKLNLALDHEFH